MTIREKIIEYLGTHPPQGITQSELAQQIGASEAGVANAMARLLETQKIRIARMDSRKRVYEVVQ